MHESKSKKCILCVFPPQDIGAVRAITPFHILKIIKHSRDQ